MSFRKARYTGKERDAESGNDYFGARYYSSSMGLWLSPDWSAKEEPVPYAKLDNPQSLNLYAYMLNNPLGGVDQDGHEIVQLGQHTDKEIAAQTAALNKQLENKDLSASDRSSINAKIQTLATEKEGNAVGNAFLSRLDAVGERGNLNLSDLSVTTDPANDFKGKGVSSDDLVHLASTSVKGFEWQGKIYLTQSSIYNEVINPFNSAAQRRQMADVGGAVIKHEQDHREGGDESRASGVGGRVFQKFKGDFTPSNFKQWSDAVTHSDQ